MPEYIPQPGAPVVTQGEDPNSTSTETIVNGSSNNANFQPNLDTVVEKVTETQVTTPPEPDPIVSDDDDPIIASINGVQRKQVNNEPDKPVADAPVVATDSTVQPTWEDEKTALLAKITQYETRQAAIEEFEKDKVGFVAKYIPGVVLESFQPVAYVQSKINEKYGERNEAGEFIPFTPDPVKALIPGTPDYNYRLDLEKFQQEANGILTQANTSVEQSKTEGTERFNKSKTVVMQKYNLTEEQFKTHVWDELEQVDNGSALELMAEALMSRKKIQAMNGNISNGVKRTEIPPSVVDVNTVSKIVDEEDALLAGIYGKKR